jgi:hypothetical protein
MNFSRMVLGILVLPLTAISQCPKEATNCTTITKPVNGEGPGTETSTSYDNRARAEVISRTAEEVTLRGMNFIFVTLPAIKTAQNERHNRADGKFTNAYETINLLAATDLTSVALGQPITPLLKGHHLGETWIEFLALAPRLRVEADRCLEEVRSNQKKKKNSSIFNPCRDIWRIVDNPNAEITFTCLEPYFGPRKDMLCQDLDGEVSFRGGGLRSLKLVIPDGLKETFPDIVSKFGYPSAEDRASTLDIWKTRDFFLLVTEVDGNTVLSWMTPETYASLSRRAKSIIAAQEQHEINKLD